MLGKEKIAASTGIVLSLDGKYPLVARSSMGVQRKIVAGKDNFDRGGNGGNGNFFPFVYYFSILVDQLPSHQGWNGIIPVLILEGYG